MGSCPTEKIADYENTIRQIKDVISAKIVTNESGDIAEVHVLASQNRGPKQLVRDIESAMMAQFGFAIDHKKVSVAQMQQDVAEAPIQNARARLGKVDLVVSGISAEAKVDLSIGDEIYTGKASGTSATKNRMRLIAQAALAALEQYLKGTCTFAVEDVRLVQLAGQEAAVVCLSLVTIFEEECLIGSALVKGDAWKTIVRATLDAVNRRLSLLVKD